MLFERERKSIKSFCKSLQIIYTWKVKILGKPSSEKKVKKLLGHQRKTQNSKTQFRCAGLLEYGTGRVGRGKAKKKRSEERRHSSREKSKGKKKKSCNFIFPVSVGIWEVLKPRARLNQKHFFDNFFPFLRSQRIYKTLNSCK